MKKEEVKVRILERDFTIACGINERSSLESAAAHLNNRLKIMQTTQTKIIGVEHILILAALNLTNELLNSRDVDSRKDAESLELLRKLSKKVGSVTHSD